MLFFDGVFGLAMLALWLFCILDVITTPEYGTRNLPKLVWLLIVILLPDIGSIAWLIAGRDWSARTSRDLPYKGNTGRRPAQPAAVTRATSPDDDAEFIAGLKARAEEQRRRAREADEGPTG